VVDRSVGASLVVLYAKTPVDSIRWGQSQGCLQAAVRAHWDAQALQPVQQRLVAAAAGFAAVHMALALEEVKQLSLAHWEALVHGIAGHQLSVFEAASCRLQLGLTDHTSEALCHCVVELGGETGRWSVAEIVAIVRVHIHLVDLHIVPGAAVQAAHEWERIVVVLDSSASDAVIAH
jgi:hypothetical protein